MAGARRKGTQRGRAEWHAARARDEGTRRGYTERCHVARTRESRYSAESGQAEEENGKGGGRSAGRGHHGAQRRKRSSCHARKTERRRGGGWRRPKELGVGRSRHGAWRRERSSCHAQHSGAEAHAAKNAQVLRARAGRKKRGRGAGGGRSREGGAGGGWRKVGGSWRQLGKRWRAQEAGRRRDGGAATRHLEPETAAGGREPTEDGWPARPRGRRGHRSAAARAGSAAAPAASSTASWWLQRSKKAEEMPQRKVQQTKKKNVGEAQRPRCPQPRPRQVEPKEPKEPKAERAGEPGFEPTPLRMSGAMLTVTPRWRNGRTSRKTHKRMERCSTARWLQPSKEAAEKRKLESLLFVTVSLVDLLRSPVNLDGTVGFPNGFCEVPPARDRAQLSSVPKAVTPQTL